MLCCSFRDGDPPTIRLISPELLHIFDQTMSLLPFATKTDMYEALKAADKKASSVDSFLSTLRLEHFQPNSATQLRRLWIDHAKAMFPNEEEDLAAEQAEGGMSLSASMPTPPASPPSGGCI